LAIRNGSTAEAKAIMEKFGSSTKANRSGSRGWPGGLLARGS
jgi:hypothetical protein